MQVIHLSCNFKSTNIYINLLVDGTVWVEAVVSLVTVGVVTVLSETVVPLVAVSVMVLSDVVGTSAVRYIHITLKLIQIDPISILVVISM